MKSGQNLLVQVLDFLVRHQRSINVILSIIVAISVARWLTLPGMTAKTYEDLDINIESAESAGDVDERSPMPPIEEVTIDEDELLTDEDEAIENKVDETSGSEVATEHPVHSSQDEGSAEPPKGEIGGSISWMLRGEKLVISGEGALPDFESEEEVPWRDWRTSIEHVVLSDGMTELGDYALYGLENVTEIEWPDELHRIGKQALAKCMKLKTLALPAQLRLIEEDAFEGDENLKKLTIQHDMTLEVSKGALDATLLSEELQQAKGRICLRVDGSVDLLDEPQKRREDDTATSESSDEASAQDVLNKNAMPDVALVPEVSAKGLSIFSGASENAEGHPVSTFHENGWTVTYGIYHSDTHRLETPAHYIVHDGEEVTYRVTLTNPGSELMTSSLTDLMVDLTATRTVFEWEKGTNVQVSSSLNSAPIEEGYRIATSGTVAEPVQTLSWPDEATVTLAAGESATIDIALTYPQGEDFKVYARKVNNVLSKNTMHSADEMVTIKHSMAVRAEAILQKGVLTTGYKSGSQYIDDGDRNFYVNSKNAERYVIYYITLYNSGATRLYLSPITETLPKGLKYQALVYGKAAKTASLVAQRTASGTSETTTTPANDTQARRGNWTDLGGTSIYYNSYVSLKYVPNTNLLTISFLANSGTADQDHLIEEENRPYLAPGRAVEFAILCTIGQKAQTEDLATNTISMEFKDYLGMGLDVADVTFGARSDMATTGQNNGNCTFKNGRLVSTVTMQRAGDETWQSHIRVTDREDHHPLAGASFALYTTNASDAMRDTDWLSLAQAPTRTMKVEGASWYLSKVATSAEDGSLSFDELTEKAYLVVQYEAPRGYLMDTTVYSCNKVAVKDDVLSIDVSNAAGCELPETGGVGSFIYRIIGLGVLLAALLLWRKHTFGQRRPGES